MRGFVLLTLMAANSKTVDIEGVAEIDAPDVPAPPPIDDAQAARFAAALEAAQAEGPVGGQGDPHYTAQVAICHYFLWLARERHRDRHRRRRIQQRKQRRGYN